MRSLRWRIEMFHKATHWEHVIFYRESCSLCHSLYKRVKSRDVCLNHSFLRAECQAFLSDSVFTWTIPRTPSPWSGLPSSLHLFKCYSHLQLKWILLKVFGDLPYLLLVLYILVTIYFMYYIGSNSINIRFLLHNKLWTLLRFEY